MLECSNICPVAGRIIVLTWEEENDAWETKERVRASADSAPLNDRSLTFWRSTIWRVRRDQSDQMDEDDDFFSMRGRFRVPEKRKRLQDDDDSTNSETESSMLSFV